MNKKTEPYLTAAVRRNLRAPFGLAGLALTRLCTAAITFAGSVKTHACKSTLPRVDHCKNAGTSFTSNDPTQPGLPTVLSGESKFFLDGSPLPRNRALPEIAASPRFAYGLRAA